MNESVAISAKNVSKCYWLYARPQDRLKESLFGRFGRNYAREFMALRDITFEVPRGESVGIIGRNGSGKSTLLQIIAGTLQPTRGNLQVNGRVAALLELGSGFNPEFTGRENVYLNGAILGLREKEIDALFDEIVAFADIGQFIDQPVKLYSSGMFVRLAFAVQAVVPKDIFIVDEALSVGDEAFQRKCMAILERFKENGGTVLFVSHNAQMVVRQCERVLLLNDGQLVADGESKPITDLYHKMMFSDAPTAAKILATLTRDGLARALFDAPRESPRAQIDALDNKSLTSALSLDWFDPNLPQPSEIVYGNGDAEIFDLGMFNARGQRVNNMIMGEQYEWRYKVRFLKQARNVAFGMTIKTVDGIEVAGTNNTRNPLAFVTAKSVIEIKFAITMNLTPAVYFLNSGVASFVLPEGTQFLHRRVDTYSIRVIARNGQEAIGLAFIQPSFQFTVLRTDR